MTKSEQDLLAAARSRIAKAHNAGNRALFAQLRKGQDHAEWIDTLVLMVRTGISANFHLSKEETEQNTEYFIEALKAVVSEYQPIPRKTTQRLM